MANAYTTTAEVATFLGKTFTDDQETQAATLVTVAQAYIDRCTHKTWVDTVITAERYDLIGATIYLRTHPVASIQLVQTRSGAVGDTLQTLTAGVQYELLDPNLGQVNFLAAYAFNLGRRPRRPGLAFISYTPNTPVPADIGWAATLIAAYSMMPTVYADRMGIQKAQADAHTSITYAANGTMATIPDLAQQIIDGYTLPVIA